MFDFENLFSFDGTEALIAQFEGNLERRFDLFIEAISKTEKEIKDSIESLKKETTQLSQNVSNYPEENNNIPTAEDIEIFEDMYIKHYEQNLNIDYLVAISEMKVISLFKNLEISMKTLIQSGYPKIKTKDFYQWDYMVSFFKSININISSISGYNEAVELRKVNNCIKHTNSISEEVKKIAEFSTLTDFLPDDIDKFILRVKPKVESFYNNLVKEVKQDIFVFNEQRIDELCDEYAKRMDKASLISFTSKLNEKIK